MSPSLRQALLNHDWPGNIRELENVMRQLLVLRDSEMVCAQLQRTRRKVAPAQAGGRPSTNGNGHPAALLAAPAPDQSGDSERQAESQNLNGAISPAQHFEPDSADRPAPHMLEKVDEFKRNAEANVILSALKTTRWNRRQAADLLKVDYKALLYKMKKLKITA